MIKDNAALLQPILSSCTTVVALAKELQILLQRIIPAPPRQEPIHASAEIILRELDQDLRWENVQYVDDSLSKVTATQVDGSCRMHEVTLVLPFDYPKSMLTLNAAFPNTQDQTTSHSSVSVALKWLQSQLSRYQDLWNCLTFIDRSLHVIEPQPGLCSLSVTYRRLKVNAQVSMRLDFDDNANPTFTLYGPDAKIMPLYERIHSLGHLWNSKDPVPSLNKILGLTLPPAASENDSVTKADEVEALTCEICYMQDENDDLSADQKLTNWFECEHCLKSFHNDCLRDWCVALPNARRSFNKIMATCPSCQAVRFDFLLLTHYKNILVKIQ